MAALPSLRSSHSYASIGQVFRLLHIFHHPTTRLLSSCLFRYRHSNADFPANDGQMVAGSVNRRCAPTDITYSNNVLLLQAFPDHLGHRGRYYRPVGKCQIENLHQKRGPLTYRGLGGHTIVV